MGMRLGTRLGIRRATRCGAQARRSRLPGSQPFSVPLRGKLETRKSKRENRESKNEFRLRGVMQVTPRSIFFYACDETPVRRKLIASDGNFCSRDFQAHQAVICV